MVAGGAPLRSTVLYGSCDATTAGFLEAVSPQVAVISVGAGNRFGHPCAGVLERLKAVPLYRTDRHGAVEITSDGVQVWVATGR